MVIKFGGHAMGDAALADAFAQDIVLPQAVGREPHRRARRRPADRRPCSRSCSIKSDFVHGLRVTDKPTVEVVEMVLAGLINKDIVIGHQPAGRQGGRHLAARTPT